MKVFVINNNGNPLMPTTPRKARILLKSGKAEVVQRIPFSIRLLYPTGNATQPITLGMDTGYSNVGFSAVTEKEELIAGEVQLLTGMVERNQERTMYRRTRRNRLRHRKPGFDQNTNKEGWFAPSIRHKLDSHVRFVAKLYELLPITKIVVEIGKFDIQKIKNPDIKGKQYQEGEKKGYENLRAYILHRDGYKCQNPDCPVTTGKYRRLDIHHIVYRSNGGSDRPNNLITLCSRCHTPKNHKGFLLAWRPKTRGFKDATFMNTVKLKVFDILKQTYENVEATYGYLTKMRRLELGLEKSHANDAFCTVNGDKQIRHQPFIIRQVRRNNRSLSKFYDAKYIDSRDGSTKSGQDMNSGRTCRNKNLNTENLRQYRQQRIKKGRYSIRKKRYPLQPMDLVEVEGKLYYSAGMHNKGKSVTFKGLKKSLTPKKVKLIKYGKGFCWLDPKVVC
ncbi:TPA: paclitaxel/taxanoid biosynthesis susceptibility protein TS1 [Methanosarcinaceae archaeon]|nr:paclitaxel/taxanoid biosynthesis susceptibility protein TS1 [Methanosarcinaceae archaeon]